MREIYNLTNFFPNDERYGLVSQLRRAAISVCCNIAEGAARLSSKEKKRFYEIARASVVEIDTQIEIALQLNYLSAQEIMDFEKNEESAFRMLSKMIANLTPERNDSDSSTI